jgi:hypothetical protein
VSEAEKLCLQHADLAGRLAAVVEWFVAHDGACLRDNPAVLALACETLAEAIALREDGSADVAEFVAARRESIGRGARRATGRFRL